MKKYGLSDKLQNIASEYEGLIVAKILSQEKGLYRLVSSNGEKFGGISGKFYYEVNKKSEFPGVGDFVMADLVTVRTQKKKRDAQYKMLLEVASCLMIDFNPISNY